MKDAIATTSMTTTLYRTEARLVAEQIALRDALKALVHATKETDNHSRQLVAIIFTAVAEVCDAVCDPVRRGFLRHTVGGAPLTP